MKSRVGTAAKWGGFVTLGWVAGAAGATTPSYDITQLGFVGNNYSYPGNGGTYQMTAAVQMNEAGVVLGTSNRYDAAGANLGADAWIFNGTSTLSIGLTGSLYKRSDAKTGSTSELSTAVQLNAAGQAIGTTTRFSGTSNLGADAWLFNGKASRFLGLTGPGDGYVVPAGTLQYNTPIALNNVGTVVGVTARFGSGGASLGNDAWLFNGVNTVQIGFTGSTYSSDLGGTFQSSNVMALNDAGQAIGNSLRFDGDKFAVGQDAWIFSGTNGRQIGLVGVGYSSLDAGGTGTAIVQNSTPTQLNRNGQVLGSSARYNAASQGNGQDAWLFDGNITRQIGLGGQPGHFLTYTGTGGGIWQESTPVQLNNAGRAIGTTVRYEGITQFVNPGVNNGHDAWIFDGTTNRQIGLTGPNYGYVDPNRFNSPTVQMSDPVQINDAGQAIGTSRRYSSVYGSALGQDAWFYNGTSTIQIGLTGPGYGYTTASPGSQIYENSTPLRVNAVGDVIGTTTLYNSASASGTAGWFFDPTTDVTTPLRFSATTTAPIVLTDSGVVLGTYELFSGSVDQGTHLFYWSGSSGFHDIGSLVEGGLSAHGWQSLTLVYGSDVPGAVGSSAGGSPTYVLGTGSVTGQSPYGSSVYLLTATPEPSVLIAGLGMLAMRGRRRSRRSKTESLATPRVA